MALLDDLVRLQYGKPLTDAIRDISASIVRGKSAPIIAQYLSQMQIDSATGENRPGASVALDLLSPEWVASLRNKALAELLDVTGGQFTPEMKEFASLSDTILKEINKSRLEAAQGKYYERLSSKTDQTVALARQGILANLDAPEIKPYAGKIASLIPKYITDEKYDYEGLAKEALGESATPDKVGMLAAALAASGTPGGQTLEQKRSAKELELKTKFANEFDAFLNDPLSSKPLIDRYKIDINNPLDVARARNQYVAEKVVSITASSEDLQDPLRLKFFQSEAYKRFLKKSEGSSSPSPPSKSKPQPEPQANQQGYSLDWIRRLDEIRRAKREEDIARRLRIEGLEPNRKPTIDTKELLEFVDSLYQKRLKDEDKAKEIFDFLEKNREKK